LGLWGFWFFVFKERLLGFWFLKRLEQKEEFVEVCFLFLSLSRAFRFSLFLFPKRKRITQRNKGLEGFFFAFSLYKGETKIKEKEKSVEKTRGRKEERSEKRNTHSLFPFSFWAFRFSLGLRSV